MITKAKKDVKQNFVYVILSVIIILTVYVLIQCIMLLKKPTYSMLVKNGKLINYEEVVGYVIREEELIDVSKYTGNRQIVISDASRAAKNDTIVSYVSDDKNDYEEKIAELDVEIQELMELQKTIYSPDVKNLENDIQTKVYQILKVKNNIYDIKQLKKEITQNLEKKASIVGELSPTGSKLNSLISDRMKYENKLNESKKDLKAEKAALVSYRIDGYENVLTPNSFSKLKINDLENIKLNVNQIIPIDDSQIKMINNFYCYIAVPMESEESKNLKLNDTVKISFNGDVNNYDKANVEYILEEDGKRLVILKITNNIEKLVEYRKVSFDIIWWNYQGLKVSNNAIYDKEIKNDLTGEVYAKVKAVKIQGVGYQKEVWVKIEKSVDEFAIIENYKDEELLALGVPEELVDNRYEISMYDEVFLNE